MKKHKGEGAPGVSEAEELMETEGGPTGLTSRKLEAPPVNKKEAREAAEAARRVQNATQEQRDDQTSVFVSNLAFTLEEPEMKLRELFHSCGSIQQVRAIYNNKGTFRGYCYVQFEDQASVPLALKLDRQDVEGRPMFVSPCVDKNKNPNFKVTAENAFGWGAAGLEALDLYPFFPFRFSSIAQLWRNTRSLSPVFHSAAPRSSWRRCAKSMAQSRMSAWSPTGLGSPRSEPA